ncbi:MAG: asparagine synthase (glutamine-hydrolyzing) [Gaiellaceae bacterium]
MCGIAGIHNITGEPVDERVLRRMTDAIAHRGPDGEGWFVDGAVGLGNRRLAIIDLSRAGFQPLANEDGSVVVTYNGEIYNFRALRDELERAGHRFASGADTEVIVHAYEEYGSACVHRFDGMFAFGLWDVSRQRLVLARDRYGVKPLYWWFRGGTLLFASEVKALLEHPAVRAEVSVEALDEYFAFQNAFSDLTLFDGVKMLQPGCTLTVEHGGEPAIERWWDWEFRDGDATAEDVRDAFTNAVRAQLVSDVPVGSYLSGGMDSASIVSVAASQLPRLATFTAGFDLSSASGLELGFDERADAEALANEFKTEHYEIVLHAGDMEWVLPTLVWHLEDLRVGQSYPNYYVARLASRFVKVVLSGAGGDELFAGYPWRYFRGDGNFLETYYAYWQRLTSEEEKRDLFTSSVRANLGDRSTFDVFRGVFDGWTHGYSTLDDRINASLYFELKTFLHGLLVVEDKLSMAHGLETRVPFLNERLVDLALQIPPSRKLLDVQHASFVDENEVGKRLRYERESADGKAILRDAMAQLLPAATTARKKTGFSAPDASWFRGESIDYVNRLLRDPKATMYEFLSPRFVERTLDEHVAGRVNHRLLIWSFLCFEWWCRVFLEGRADEGVAEATRRAPA